MGLKTGYGLSRVLRRAEFLGRRLWRSHWSLLKFSTLGAGMLTVNSRGVVIVGYSSGLDYTGAWRHYGAGTEWIEFCISGCPARLSTIQGHNLAVTLHSQRWRVIDTLDRFWQQRGLVKWGRGNWANRDLIFNFVYVCVCVWVCDHECNCLQRPEKGSESPYPGIIGSLSHLICLLGIELKFSTRAASALYCWTTS